MTYIEVMGPQIFAIILTVGIVSACAPGTIASDGGEDRGETGEPDEPDVAYSECDEQGRCWTRRDSWGAWAQQGDLVDLADGLLAGTLTPAASVSGAVCWTYGQTPGRTCHLIVDGLLLIGRPLEEVAIVNAAPCAPDGPWDYSASTTFWCRGVFGELAVPLRAI